MNNINLVELVKNLICSMYHTANRITFEEGEPERVEESPWECSLGEREEVLSLFRYSMTEGFKYVELPTQRQAVSARQGEEYGLVHYYSKGCVHKEGTYVLIKMRSPGSWEINEPEESTYDKYLKVFIFNK